MRIVLHIDKSKTSLLRIFSLDLLSFRWGLLLFLVGFCCIQCASKRQIRMGCFPIFGESPWLDIIITEGISDSLQKTNPKTCLLYPLDWSFGAIAQDSLSNVSYLRNYGRRIGLDYLITETVQVQFSEGCVVGIAFYDLRENQCLLEFSDSLRFGMPAHFFRSATQKVTDSFLPNSRGPVSISLPPQSVWKRYGTAKCAQLFGDMQRSEKYYRSGFESDSTSSFLLKGLAAVLLEKAFQYQDEGKYADDVYLEASHYLHRILANDSTDAQAYRLLGKLYIQQSRWNKAEGALRKALKWDGNDPFVYFLFTRLHPSRYNDLGFRNPEALLRKALSIDPAFEQAWIALGEQYYFRNKPPKAEKTYIRLLAIHPTSLNGLLALGKLYVFRNDVVNIIRVYEKVLEISPTYADAYYNLGIAYYNSRQEDKAILFFEKAIELNRHVNSHFYLGVIYAKRGDRQKAIHYFRERLHLGRGKDDTFTEEARKRLFQLIHDNEQTSFTPATGGPAYGRQAHLWRACLRQTSNGGVHS